MCCVSTRISQTAWSERQGLSTCMPGRKRLRLKCMAAQAMSEPLPPSKSHVPLLGKGTPPRFLLLPPQLISPSSAVKPSPSFPRASTSSAPQLPLPACSRLVGTPNAHLTRPLLCVGAGSMVQGPGELNRAVPWFRAMVQVPWFRDLVSLTGLTHHRGCRCHGSGTWRAGALIRAHSTPWGPKGRVC